MALTFQSWNGILNFAADRIRQIFTGTTAVYLWKHEWQSSIC